MLNSNVNKEQIDFLIKVNNIKNHNEKIRLEYAKKLQIQKYKENISELKKYMLEKNKQTNLIIEQKNREIEEKERIIQNMNISLMAIEEKKYRNIFLKLLSKIFNRNKEI